MRESRFQAMLIQEIETLFPGSYVLMNDANYIQGFPDLLILHNDRWAALEVKTSSRAAQQPNQAYYVNQLNKMSYAAFVYPENLEEVLRDLQQTFSPRRQARISKR